ncbi:ATP synthase F1 subunit delta [Desulfococcaceae bacterium OttesenSCG-928-F15]|nr:ATP synthase F1 subunit delta [Desulfococcaceae bacterium OttesenSCG-928-F15]
MKNLALSRRYAKALLLIGKESGNVDAYREELASVVGVFRENDEFRSILSNPLYPYLVRRNLLQSVLEKLSASKVILSFLLLLLDKGRIKILSEVEQCYQSLADDEENIVRAEITSAVALKEDAVSSIRDTLARHTKRNVFLELREDKGIIGGIITKVGDLIYDGSIRTQLWNLRESFKKGEGI